MLNYEVTVTSKKQPILTVPGPLACDDFTILHGRYYSLFDDPLKDKDSLHMCIGTVSELVGALNHRIIPSSQITF